jgi:hypothetical protein
MSHLRRVTSNLTWQPFKEYLEPLEDISRFYDGAGVTKFKRNLGLAFAAWTCLLLQQRQSGGGSNATGLALPPPYIAFQLDGEYEDDATMLDINHSDDQARLLYLAPVAKHHGFRLLLVHLDLGLKSTWEAHRGYREYEREYNAEDYDLTSGDLEIEPSWVVMEPDGTLTKRADAVLETLADDISRDDAMNIMNYHIDIKSGEDLEFRIESQLVSLVPSLC